MARLIGINALVRIGVTVWSVTNPADSLRAAAAILLCVLVAACASPTSSNETLAHEQAQRGDAARGLAFAQANCASCHALAAGETWSPEPAAPSFEAIANTPGMTNRAVNVWLTTSHPSMPDLIVEQDEIDDVWAYLDTLRDAGL